MFALERIRIIKKFIAEHKQAEVTQLSQMLSVSEVTIRRDLEKLEEEGFLTRTHGGAVINSLTNESIIEVQDSTTLQQCDEIARIAVQMVLDGDVIMLTNGEINLAIAKRLADKNRITVLTNDLAIALFLMESQSAKVVFLGGDLDYHTGAAFGALTIDNLKRFYVNRLFVEAHGISRELELTVSSIDMSTLLQEASQNADDCIIVCKSSVFDRNAFFRAGRITRLSNKIITNHDIPDLFKNIIFSKNIQLFTSIDLLEGKV